MALDQAKRTKRAMVRTVVQTAIILMKVEAEPVIRKMNRSPKNQEKLQVLIRRQKKLQEVTTLENRGEVLLLK